jgi:hypothetical protein
MTQSQERLRQRGITKNWQCTVRPKVLQQMKLVSLSSSSSSYVPFFCFQLNKCPATVNETSDSFRLGSKDHNHTLDVGSATTAVVTREIRKPGHEQSFQACHSNC